MNFDKLKRAEEDFLNRYPGGFYNPVMIEVGKKHKMDKMISFAQEGFEKQRFQFPERILETMTKIVSRSSMISIFEKPKFQEYTHSLSPVSRKILSDGLEELLYGKEQYGFETILEVLKNGKLAKWSLMTICQTYFRPEFEVFIKPTTTKWVIQYFEISHLQYHPSPTWFFYDAYRTLINDIKSRVDPSLAQYNAAFTAFLMLSMEKSEIPSMHKREIV